MRLTSRLDDERKSGAIWYVIFRQSPNSAEAVHRDRHLFRFPALGCLLAMLVWGCSSRNEPWKDPYPGKDETANVSYTSFIERPKHLDPARSCSANEFRFIAQIYEPPLQLR